MLRIASRPRPPAGNIYKFPLSSTSTGFTAMYTEQYTFQGKYKEHTWEIEHSSVLSFCMASYNKCVHIEMRIRETAMYCAKPLSSQLDCWLQVGEIFRSIPLHLFWTLSHQPISFRLSQSCQSCQTPGYLTLCTKKWLSWPWQSSCSTKNSLLLVIYLQSWSDRLIKYHTQLRVSLQLELVLH